MDLVLFAGPVTLTPAHQQVDWHGRDVRVALIQGSGSSNFRALGESLRDADGRILPNVLRRYAPGLEPDKIALASFSAGYGLVDSILAVPEDRARITATVLSDSVFLSGDPRTGVGGPVHPGIVEFGAEAVGGSKLLVATEAHTTDGTHLDGMQSWTLTWQAIQARARCLACGPSEVQPPAPVPPAPEGWWRLGSECWWGDYGNTVSHGDHTTELGPLVWQGFLAPWLAGTSSLVWLGAAFGVAVGYGLWKATAASR